jgi:5-methylcytosine-specific restriction endonuclease McrA
MNYSQKLRDPKWQRLRLEVFNRDNFTCTNCGSAHKEIQVHHLDYITGIEPWEYPLDMLTTLCCDCHAKENERTKHETYLLNSLKMKGFLANDVLKLSCIIDTDPKFTKSFKNLLRNF